MCLHLWVSLLSLLSYCLLLSSLWIPNKGHWVGLGTCYHFCFCQDIAKGFGYSLIIDRMNWTKQWTEHQLGSNWSCCGRRRLGGITGIAVWLPFSHNALSRNLWDCKQDVSWEVSCTCDGPCSVVWIWESMVGQSLHELAQSLLGWVSKITNCVEKPFVQPWKIRKLAVPCIFKI